MALDAEAWLTLRCLCGRSVPTSRPVADAAVVCRCGERLAAWRQGLLEIGAPVGYWGEMPAARLQSLLQEARQSHWRQAVDRWLPAPLRDYAAHPDRAAFADVLPLPAQGRILEIGAGLGGIAACLAQQYAVVALEGVAERAAFLALRAQQDGLTRLLPVRADWHRLCFAPGQFDAVVLNGVLEWVPVADISAPPRQVQVAFLRAVRELLAPGGFIYLAIENRFGLPQWRGAVDHSGLRYTSLMPRAVARAVCRRHSDPYRSPGNRGYRTYTYSPLGYERLFRQSGLRRRQAYLCPRGYNLPVDIIPLQREVLAFRARHQHWQTHRPIRAWLHRRLGAVWFWGAVGGDLAFVLDAGETPAAPPTAPARASRGE
ncbi:MAG: class I SAM-dependent methyltransferase [Terriglobales bacterium]